MASKRNGDLLRLAENEFDVFLTVDRKLEYQQNLSTFNIGVVALVAPTYTVIDLQRLMASVLENLSRVKRGEALVFSARVYSRHR